MPAALPGQLKTSKVRRAEQDEAILKASCKL
jgi:hypothetical protein